MMSAAKHPFRPHDLRDTFKKTQSGTNYLFPTESLLNHPSRRGEEVAVLHVHTEVRSRSVHCLHAFLLRTAKYDRGTIDRDGALPLSYGTHRPGGIRTRDLLVMSEVSLFFTTGRT